jgi:hypothetical protein
MIETVIKIELGLGEIEAWKKMRKEIKHHH